MPDCGVGERSVPSDPANDLQDLRKDIIRQIGLALCESAAPGGLGFVQQFQRLSNAALSALA